MSPAAAVAYLVDYEGRPDDVDARIGRPDHAQVDHEGPLRAGHRHRRRAPALAVPHDPYAAPAAGKDGAVLAQPLRHRLQQAGRRLRRPCRRPRCSRTSPACCAGRRDRSSSSASTRSATFATSCCRWRRIPRCWCGSMARATPKRSRRRTSAARSWSCSRSASATTPSRTSTPPRVCSPAGTCGGPTTTARTSMAT